MENVGDRKWKEKGKDKPFSAMKEIEELSLKSENEWEEEEEETQQEQEQQQKPKAEEDEEERMLLQFLDSTDDYLNLSHQLSSILRQGWFDLASARHSMGTSRVTSALLDFNVHSAATSLRLHQPHHETQPFINLRKWTSNEDEDNYNHKLQRKSDTSQLRQRNISEISEDSMGKSSVKKEDTLIVDDQVQKERSRILSTFGTLVSPKLRSAQLSFENALEIIVEIANKRIAMLTSFEQVKKGLEDKSSLEQATEGEKGTTDT